MRIFLFLTIFLCSCMQLIGMDSPRYNSKALDKDLEMQAIVPVDEHDEANIQEEINEETNDEECDNEENADENNEETFFDKATITSLKCVGGFSLVTLGTFIHNPFTLKILAGTNAVASTCACCCLLGGCIYKKYKRR